MCRRLFLGNTPDHYTAFEYVGFIREMVSETYCAISNFYTDRY
jgi:hypothetical protein